MPSHGHSTDTHPWPDFPADSLTPMDRLPTQDTSRNAPRAGWSRTKTPCGHNLIYSRDIVEASWGRHGDTVGAPLADIMDIFPGHHGGVVEMPWRRHGDTVGAPLETRRGTYPRHRGTPRGHRLGMCMPSDTLWRRNVYLVYGTGPTMYSPFRLLLERCMYII